jgi:hypothetical protein
MQECVMIKPKVQKTVKEADWKLKLLGWGLGKTTGGR